MTDKLILQLTEVEAKALLTCAGEGFQGLANDASAARGYLGGKRGVDAAERAIDKLRSLTHGSK